MKKIQVVFLQQKIYFLVVVILLQLFFKYQHELLIILEEYVRRNTKRNVKLDFVHEGLQLNYEEMDSLLRSKSLAEADKVSILGKCQMFVKSMCWKSKNYLLQNRFFTACRGHRVPEKKSYSVKFRMADTSFLALFFYLGVRTKYHILY